MLCHLSAKRIFTFKQFMAARYLSLVKEKAFIDGTWAEADSGATFDVVNPYNQVVVAKVPDMNINDAERGINSAYEAFRTWQHVSAKERSYLLRKWYHIIDENKEEIAKIITAEAGKPLQEALNEVIYGNSFIEWFSEEARRIHGEIIESPVGTKEIMVVKQPIGVVGLITPWNFPIAMITRKAGAALAAGCTCVVKPAEDTPLTALALAKLAEDAGFPKGLFNVITCSRKNAPAVGQLICESPKVAGISFTGSTNVGKLLYKQCAQGVKRIGLELGGNAPFIVFDSADIQKAVAGAMASKFRNCGQTCVSANRFLVQEDVFDKFVSMLKQEMEQKLHLGDTTNPQNNLGPLINQPQLEKVESIVKDAVQKGANILLGGNRASSVGPLFFEPTLLTGITPNMRCYTEEIFGPVVTVIKFKSEEEALDIANNTNSGLAGYFYSSNMAQVRRVAKQLCVGMIGINEGIISTAEAPFGGVKESGIGREGSHHGIDEYTFIKYMCVGNL